MNKKPKTAAVAKVATLRENLMEWAGIARKSKRYRDMTNLGVAHIVSNFTMYTLARYGEQKAEKAETDRRRAEHNALRADLCKLQKLVVKVGGRTAEVSRLGAVRFSKADASGVPTQSTQSLTIRKSLNVKDRRNWIAEVAAANGLTVTESK